MPFIPERLRLELIRAEVTKRDKRTCQYCGKKSLRGRSLHLDHVHPEAEGGEFVVSNLVVACAQCNFRKGKRSATTYAESRLKQLDVERAMLLNILDNKTD
jgi:5-methylcytosine-specific restriction endonuclease McrA